MVMNKEKETRSLSLFFLKLNMHNKIIEIIKGKKVSFVDMLRPTNNEKKKSFLYKSLI
jgi:hypothetical protein